MDKRLAFAGTNGQPVPTARGISWFGVSWFGVSWDICVRFALSAAIIVASGLPIARLVATAGERISVIVREADGAGAEPEHLVRQLGGKVEFQLPLIGGFSATLPPAAVDAVAAGHGIVAVTPDGQVHFNMAGDGYDATSTMGSLYNTARAIGATELWRRGITGRGVDVAVIDTGVNPDPEFSGRLLNGPDLSFDSQTPKLRYVDGYGHGTHMASIIAARDPRLPSGDQLNDPDYFVGMAPEARIVNVKVGGSNGVTDVSQVIAAVDWVVQHRNTDGLNIRVLNLSFGTNGTQSYVLDPLTFAVERAWFEGIVVVASAGNEGYGSSMLDNPAYDPFVIAVGADDLHGTIYPDDDRLADFSNRGTTKRGPDLVAPGLSVVGLRAPGSYLDMKYPGGRVGTEYFKGSGTSQSTAVVSGAAALVLSARPTLKPDQVKALLTDTADYLPNADPQGQGAGRVNAAQAAWGRVPVNALQTFTRATGLGLVQASRGSAIVADRHGVPLVGEMDIFGHAYSVLTSGNSWSGGTWNGNSWSGNSWSGNSWSVAVWLGNSWSGNSWSADDWLGNSWSGNSWSGSSWSCSIYSMAPMGGDDGR
jgi:serine protease AprX